MTPHFFYISVIANSSSFNGKIFRKKSMLENFRANVLKELGWDNLETRRQKLKAEMVYKSVNGTQVFVFEIHSDGVM